MREQRITCDRCGAEITGNPFTACIERVGREADAPVITGETFVLDLCEKCADELHSWKAVHASASVFPEPGSPHVKLHVDLNTGAVKSVSNTEEKEN